MLSVEVKKNLRRGRKEIARGIKKKEAELRVLKEQANAIAVILEGKTTHTHTYTTETEGEENFHFTPVARVSTVTGNKRRKRKRKVSTATRRKMSKSAKKTHAKRRKTRRTS